MKLFWTLASRDRWNLIVLVVTGICFWIGFGSQLPMLPLYIRDLGATEQQLGFIMGAFALGILSSRTWLGIIADQYSRKIVLQIGLAVATISPLLYLGFKPLHILYTIRLFHGISLAAFTTAYTATVIDLSPLNSRGELISLMSLVNPIGLMIGPVIGGFLQTRAGYLPVFLFASGIGVAGVLSASTINHIPPTTNRAVGKNRKYQPFWKQMNAPRLKVPIIVMLLIGLTFGAFTSFVPLLIQATGAELNPGLIYSTAAIANFSARLMISKASDRLGRGRLISISLCCYILTMIALYLANTTAEFLLAGIFLGCGSGSLIPMISTLMADRSQSHERARVLSYCISGFDIGIALAGPSLGSVAKLTGIRSIFGLASILGSLAFIVFATSNSKNLNHSLAFAFSNGQDIYALQSASSGDSQKY